MTDLSVPFLTARQLANVAVLTVYVLHGASLA